MSAPPTTPQLTAGLEAEALATVWPPEKVAALLRRLREKAIEARDENWNGELVLSVGLVSGRPSRMTLTSEEPI
jgi:hypothetical protein